MFKRIGLVLLAAAMVLPVAQVHAGHTTAKIVIGTAAGVIAGAALQDACSHKHHKHRVHHHQAPRYEPHCSRTCTIPQLEYQKLLMKQVMADYNPCNHQRWIEYVAIDLQGKLSPEQQRTLIQLLQSRQCCA